MNMKIEQFAVDHVKPEPKFGWLQDRLED